MEAPRVLLDHRALVALKGSLDLKVLRAFRVWPARVEVVDRRVHRDLKAYRVTRELRALDLRA
jgi:hypothetical protein